MSEVVRMADCTEKRDSDLSIRSFRFWILPVTGMLSIIVTASDYCTFGLLFLELQDSFSVSKFVLGFFYSVYCTSGFFVGLLCPVILRKFGYRLVGLTAACIYLIGTVLCAYAPNIYCLFLSYGVVAGTGLHTLIVIQFAIVQEKVKTNIAFATSVFITGYSIGAFIWPILYKKLLDAYTWRGAFLLQGVIGVNSFLLLMIQTSTLLKINTFSDKIINTKEEDIDLDKVDNKNNDQQQVDAKKETLCPKIDLKRTFRTDSTIWLVFITFAYFFYCCGDTFSHYMIAVRLDYIHLSKQQIVTVMSARGAIGFLRFLPCYLIDKFKLNRTKVAGLLSFILGLSTMISATFKVFHVILGFFIAWGFLQAVQCSLIVPVFVDVFTKKRVHMAVGCCTMAINSASFVSMPLCGILLDMMEDINIPILMFGGLQILAASMIITISFCRSKSAD